MTAWLKQSTSVSVVIGPIWATANGALKADLAYNASGINCDIYKNGTKADVTLANSAGDGYFRAASGESLYLLTLSTGHTDTLGMLTISLSATGYYMKPQHYMVVPANVWDSMFGADMLKVDVHSIDDDETAADNLEAACDNYSATRGLAGTALPAAAADAAGGLPISDAGGLDLDAKLANTNEVTAARMGALTDLIDGGRLDLLIDAIKAKTDSLTFTVAGDVDCNVQTWKGSAAADMTGDAYARLGAPTGASVSADLADIEGKVDDLEGRVIGTIAAGTHNPQSGDAYARLGDPVGASVSADIADIPTAVENADALLKRDWTSVSGEAARSVLNALRLLRNKVDTTTTPGTLTVCEEDDSTPAWTAAITTDAAAEPITEIDPA